MAANINSIGKISRRPINMKAASTSRAGWLKASVNDAVGPASSSAGPMLPSDPMIAPMVVSSPPPRPVTIRTPASTSRR